MIKTRLKAKELLEKYDKKAAIAQATQILYLCNPRDRIFWEEVIRQLEGIQ